ncbi:MAG: NAD(P)-dependent oxidoreductase [Actinomycetales bacterium]|nr:NAD(P)-dependent oxidoreductase [Actinomycetales bacterium]
MATMLLTGSNGFVGSHTTDAAQAAGWRVIGLGRSAQPARRRQAAGGSTATSATTCVARSSPPRRPPRRAP